MNELLIKYNLTVLHVEDETKYSDEISKTISSLNPVRRPDQIHFTPPSLPLPCETLQEIEIN